MNLAIILGADEPIDPARSLHPFLPPTYEIILGGLASLIVFGLLWKLGGPPIRKAMAERTQGIQDELDASAADREAAIGEAESIRQAAGDIDAERQRRFAEADAHAEALLADGRARLEEEVAELHARADAEIASATGRIGDELRAEILRLSSGATERLLADGAIDDATHQELIESYIARVGAS